MTRSQKEGKFLRPPLEEGLRGFAYSLPSFSSEVCVAAAACSLTAGTSSDPFSGKHGLEGHDFNDLVQSYYMVLYLY